MKLSTPQRALLAWVETANEPVAVSGPTLRTAEALARKGLLKVSARRHSDGKQIVAYTRHAGGWSYYAEKKDAAS